jgi:hypothetical protein
LFFVALIHLRRRSPVATAIFRRQYHDFGAGLSRKLTILLLLLAGVSIFIAALGEFDLDECVDVIHVRRARPFLNNGIWTTNVSFCASRALLPLPRIGIPHESCVTLDGTFLSCNLFN